MTQERGIFSLQGKSFLSSSLAEHTLQSHGSPGSSCCSKSPSPLHSRVDNVGDNGVPKFEYKILSILKYRIGVSINMIR